MTQDVTQSLGKLRIGVAHTVEGASPTETQCHRILPDISVFDVRPPEGVPALYLDAVVLSADIFELHQRKRVAIGKKPKVSELNDCGPRRRLSTVIKDLEREFPDVQPRTATDAGSLATPTSRKRGRISAPSGIKNEWSSTNTGLEIENLETLIDGALRISVLCRVNGKLLSGVKIKANTFKMGLADIAPSIWKPGYLTASKPTFAHAHEEPNN